MKKGLRIFLKVCIIIGLRIVAIIFSIFRMIVVSSILLLIVIMAYARFDIIDYVFGITPTISIKNDKAVDYFTFNNKEYIGCPNNLRIKFNRDEQMTYIAYSSHGVAFLPDRMAVYNCDEEYAFIISSAAADPPTIERESHINIDAYENLCKAPILKIEDEAVNSVFTFNDLIDQDLESLERPYGWRNNIELNIQSDYSFVEEIIMYTKVIYYNDKLYIRKINTTTFNYSYFVLKPEFQHLFEKYATSS